MPVEPNKGTENSTLPEVLDREVSRRSFLKAGLTAQLTLDFSESGQVTVVVPVVDAKQPPYATISPAPTPQA